MNKAAVIIPNFNGKQWLSPCLRALAHQTRRDFCVVLVDNGSSDGSIDMVSAQFPWVKICALKENTGFACAVNTGIRMTNEPYVILLNNDTRVGTHFVDELMREMDRHENCFSCSARMLSMDQPERIDDAGDLYCALGWAYARGKGQKSSAWNKPGRIFASCAGAAIYRRSMLDETGLFEETFFAYLEDMDLGWRARLAGYENRYAPKAKVLHHGSASSGSRYNAFKVSLTSRNSVWLIKRNMPAWQIALNAPLLVAGFVLKALFFTRKGLGREYIHGLIRGCRTDAGSPQASSGQARFCVYWRIQGELWLNTIRRIGGVFLDP